LASIWQKLKKMPPQQQQLQQWVAVVAFTPVMSGAAGSPV